MRTLLGFCAILLTIALVAWTTDAVRPRGVSAIYSVDCKPGTWEGNRCYGRMVAGPRYRFKVLAARGEVHFTSSIDPDVEVTYSRCTIEDRSNWSCDPSGPAPATIGHKMEHGHLVPDPAPETLPLHDVEKWRWLLLRIGVPVGHDAS